MPDVPMLDLEAQHAPLHAELTAVAARVLSSSRFILGDEVAAFEHEMARGHGVEHAVGVSSGSDALLALLMACGVGPGDEVVTTTFSFFATAEAIVRLGATPVFADVDPRTLNMDAEAACARMGPRTRAVLVVHLFGRVTRTRVLERLCAERGVAFLEDAAQAVGAWRDDGGARRGIGTFGQGAALSFFPSKNLGGLGDGGMVLSNDARVAETVRLVRSHGARARMEHVRIGGNFRLDELQAALLRVKLPHLPAWTEDRRAIASQYRERLESSGVELPPPDDGCVWNQFVVQIPARRREAVIAALARRGIASDVYYRTPLHLQPALSALGHRAGDFPRAEAAAAGSLALPIFPGLRTDAIARVAEAIAAAL